MLTRLQNLFALTINIIRQEQIKKRIGLEKGEVLIISSTGIGDLYLKLLLIKALKRIYRVDKVSIGLAKPKHLDVAKIFSSELYKSYLIDDKAIQILSNVTLPHSRVFHPYYQPISPALFASIGVGNFHFFDAIKIMMQLPLNVEVNLPNIPIEFRDSAKMKFKEFGLLENATVLIAPHAVTVPLLDDQFWRDLIKLFLAIDYKVAMMSDSFQIDNPDIIRVDISLGEAIPFVEQCGVFVGLRSGFCDLISSARARKIFIYPKDNYESSGEPYFSGFNFQNLSFIDKAEFLEIEPPLDANQVLNFVKNLNP